MKRLLFGIVLLLVITSVAYSQEPTQPLRLTINSDKQIYEVGEEIKIKLVFQNNTQEKIAIFKHILMTYNIEFQISVITPTGEKFEPVAVRRLYELPVFKRDMYQEIPNNQSFEIVISLKDYFDELYDTFIVPGNYKISVKYSNDFDYYYDENAEKIKIDAFKGILTSNTINIEVVENKTGINKEKAIEIAKEYAVKQGYDLKVYQEPTTTFDETNKAWDIFFETIDPIPGGHFTVIINDKTGEVSDFWRGK